MFMTTVALSVQLYPTVRLLWSQDVRDYSRSVSTALPHGQTAVVTVLAELYCASNLTYEVQPIKSNRTA
jgi:hypothetical protein